MKRIFATFFTFAALALPALAQNATNSTTTNTTFGEKVDVNVVLLDAIVTDAKGNQILGLDKDDFIVKENGVAQTVESVDYFTNRRLLNANEQNAPFRSERVREERYFIFFFDKPSESQLWDRLALARRAATEFVNDRMQPSDRVAIVGHDVRLKVYSDFTGDKQQLRRAIDDVASFGLGIRNAPKREAAAIFNHIDASEMMNHTGTVYEALDVLAAAVRPIRARKNVVLFSPGILEHGEDVSANGVLLNRSRYYDPMIHSLNAANVTVYPINLQKDIGLQPVFHQTLENLADDTNGEYFRQAVNFGAPLKKIENVNNGYYLVTYRSNHAAGASGYQKVDVTLRNPEFRVKAREGYVYGE
jgi:VWFA-related protein